MTSTMTGPVSAVGFIKGDPNDNPAPYSVNTLPGGVLRAVATFSGAAEADHSSTPPPPIARDGDTAYRVTFDPTTGTMSPVETISKRSINATPPAPDPQGVTYRSPMGLPVDAMTAQPDDRVFLAGSETTVKAALVAGLLHRTPSGLAPTPLAVSMGVRATPEAAAVAAPAPQPNPEAATYETMEQFGEEATAVRALRGLAPRSALQALAEMTSGASVSEQTLSAIADEMAATNPDFAVGS